MGRVAQKFTIINFGPNGGGGGVYKSQFSITCRNKQLLMWLDTS